MGHWLEAVLLGVGLVLPVFGGDSGVGGGRAASEEPEGQGASREEQALREEQLRVAREVQEGVPGGDAAFALAIVYNEQGDLEAAVRSWESGLEQPRETVRLMDRAGMLAELGEALKVREQYDRAETAFRESLTLQPRREQTLLRLGELLYSRERPEECLAVLEAGGARSAAACGLRGRCHQQLGRLEEAREQYEAALRLDPDLVEACYGLSVVCSRLGLDEAAAGYRARFGALKARQQTFGREYRAALSPLRTTQQSVAMTHTTVGWLYLDRGDAVRAEALWRRAAGLDPANTACRFHLMMLCQKAGRNAEARQWCEEMVRQEPRNPFHQISLGNLELRLGNVQAAGVAFEAAYRLGPERPETCFALAQFCLRTDASAARGLELARQAVALSPVAPHQFVLSRAAVKTGDRATALEAARRAAELDPANPEYASWLRSLGAGAPP